MCSNNLEDDKFNEIIEEAQKGNSIFNAGNVIKVEDVENEKEMFTQLSISYPTSNELNDILVVKEESAKYGFSDKINNLLTKNVESYIFNNGDCELTDEGKEKIKNSIEEEIKSNEDLGEIYEANKNPIEHWIKKNVEKAHEEMVEKFILIPKIKTEHEEGEYYF